MIKYKFTAIVILLFAVIAGRAQSSTDFGIWTELGIEKEINKRWSVNGEIELRTFENSSEIRRWAAQLGADYSIIKGVKAGLAYKFMHFNDFEYSDFQPRHRGIGFVQGKKKFGRFVFTLRERFQVTTKDESDRIKSSGKTDTYKINPEWSWRNRLKVAYDIPKCKFTPSCSFESFYQLNNPDGNQFDALRYNMSLAYKLKKKHTFELSGILDKEINVNDPVSKYVLGIGYSFNL